VLLRGELCGGFITITGSRCFLPPRSCGARTYGRVRRAPGAISAWSSDTSGAAIEGGRSADHVDTRTEALVRKVVHQCAGRKPDGHTAAAAGIIRWWSNKIGFRRAKSVKLMEVHSSPTGLPRHDFLERPGSVTKGRPISPQGTSVETTMPHRSIHRHRNRPQLSARHPELSATIDPLDRRPKSDPDASPARELEALVKRSARKITNNFLIEGESVPPDVSTVLKLPIFLFPIQT